MCVWVYFFSLYYFVSLIYVLSTPILYYFDYYNFVMSIEFRKCDASNFALTYYSRSFVAPHTFQLFFFFLFLWENAIEILIEVALNLQIIWVVWKFFKLLLLLLFCCAASSLLCVGFLQLWKVGLLFIMVHWFLTVVSSLVTEPRLQVQRLRELWHTGLFAP